MGFLELNKGFSLVKRGQDGGLTEQLDRADGGPCLLFRLGRGVERGSL